MCQPCKSASEFNVNANKGIAIGVIGMVFHVIILIILGVKWNNWEKNWPSTFGNKTEDEANNLTSFILIWIAVTSGLAVLFNIFVIIGIHIWNDWLLLPYLLLYIVRIVGNPIITVISIIALDDAEKVLILSLTMIYGALTIITFCIVFVFYMKMVRENRAGAAVCYRQYRFGDLLVC